MSASLVPNYSTGFFIVRDAVLYLSGTKAEADKSSLNLNFLASTPLSITINHITFISSTRHNLPSEFKRTFLILHKVYKFPATHTILFKSREDQSHIYIGLRTRSLSQL